jgi:hypothetical protein
VMNLVRLGGVATVLFILGLMLFTRRRDPRLPIEGRV